MSTCSMVILDPCYQYLEMYATVPGYCPQLEQTRVFGCLPITPSSKSGAAPGLHQRGVGPRTPDTPELYSALNLSYNSRSGKSSEYRRSKSSGLLIRLSSSRSSGTETQSDWWDGHSAQKVSGSRRSPLFSYRLDRW